MAEIGGLSDKASCFEAVKGLEQKIGSVRTFERCRLIYFCGSL
jgi:hypothetical protein